MPSIKSDIATLRQQRTADKVLDLDDAKAIVDGAGKVSAKDLKELEASLKPNGAYEVAPEAASWLKEQISTIGNLQNQAKMINEQVAKRATTLGHEETAMLKVGSTTKSYGGTVIPEDVKKLVNAAKQNGATVYDVLQSDTSVERDEHDATQWTLGGIYSPYGVQDSIPATGPMAFSYTELTPKAIADDMSTSRDQVVLTGTKHNSQLDPRSGKNIDWDSPTYEHKTMAGTGNIIEHYDELGHPEVYALASEGEGFCKWDANFAVLADGTFHALPAMRRSDDPNFGNRILTDPSLARDKRMLFNGHIEMSGGVVTSIALSGRLNKMAAKGDAKFIDPVALLNAWGFKTAPGLQVGFEGGGGVHVDAKTNLIVKD